MDEQGPEVAIPALGHPPQGRLPARGMWPGDEAQPGSELAPSVACRRIANGRDERRGGQGANPGQLRQSLTRFISCAHPLDLLVRLFMDVELVAVATAEDLLSAEGVDAMERLGLLTRYATDPARCHAAVLLYPTESLWIASDLNASPDGSGLTELAADAVYPAVTRNTRHFLSMLPPIQLHKNYPALRETLYATFFGGLILLAVTTAATSRWTKLTTSPTLRFLGKYSYGMYVIQNFLKVSFPPELIIAAIAAGLGSIFWSRCAYLAIMSVATVVAALVSWGIAFFEYALQVPANRIGYTAMSVGQLKILQEIITLSVFVPFAFYYLKEPLKLDYLWAALCILGAVFFIFRSRLIGA